MAAIRRGRRIGRIARFAAGAAGGYSALKRAVSNKRKPARATTPAKRKGSAAKTRASPKKGSIIRSPSFGVSHSSFSFGKGRYPKSFKMISAPETIDTIGSGGATTTGVTGLQLVQTLNSHLYSSELSTLSLQNMQYFGAPTGLGNLATAGMTSYKLGIDMAQSKTMITNCEGQSCTVFLYDCIAKRDSTTFPDAPTCWTQGLSDTLKGTSLVYTAGTTMPGAVPTSSKFFNQHWRVLKRTMVEIGPGRTHEHLFKHRVNRVIDTELIRGTNTLKGLTTQTFFVAYGVPCDSLATNAVGTISLSPLKFVWVTSDRTVTRVVSSTPRGYAQGGVILSASVTPHFMNEESGGVNIAEVVG